MDSLWAWLSSVHIYHRYQSLAPLALFTDLITLCSFFFIALKLSELIHSIKISTRNLPILTLLMFATMSATQFAAFYWENYFFLMTFKVLACLFCLAAAIFFGRLQQKITQITQALHGTASLREEKLAAETANMLKTAFVANMSHEIRTPLAAILGFSEYISEPGRSEEERNNAIRAIRRNGEHLTNLVNEVLDLSKVEADRLEIENISFDLNEVLDYVTSVIRLKALENGIDFRISLADNVPKTIETDPTRLQQILLNIVGNAVKFTKKGYVELSIAWREPNRNNVKGTLIFDITDTGIGIMPTEQKKIFMPFVQADTSMTRKFGGTGLGLGLARKLAIALGGNIELVESKKNVGTKFRVSVLAKQIALMQGATLDNHVNLLPKPESFENLRLLIVEDSPDNQAIIRWMLESTGARLDLVDNGIKGVESALAVDYDLILMDVQMPVMDGYQATLTLRQKGYRKPIIAITAHASREERERCFATGFDSFLTKPINKNSLINVIAHYAPTQVLGGNLNEYTSGHESRITL